jgi:hypothetical protein
MMRGLVRLYGLLWFGLLCLGSISVAEEFTVSQLFERNRATHVLTHLRHLCPDCSLFHCSLTPNTQRLTPNTQRLTPNAQRLTPNA